MHAAGSRTQFPLFPLLVPFLNHLDLQDTGWWMLKNNKQRGTGLRLVPTSGAFQAAFETTTRPGMEGITLYRWCVLLAWRCTADMYCLSGMQCTLHWHLKCTSHSIAHRAPHLLA
jgi:hypothetical protein